MRINGQQVERLHWQSRFVTLSILAPCAVIVAFYAIQQWRASVLLDLLVSLIFAAAVWLVRAATVKGSFAGGILTAAILLSGSCTQDATWYRSSLPPLLTLFLLTFAATKFGRREKERLGIAEDRRGRVAAQVVANVGVAGLAGAILLAWLLWNGQTCQRPSLTSEPMVRSVPLATLCMTMLISALAEATADTLSSELGQVLGGEPRILTTGMRVPRGTDGAISVAGTLGGTAGAVAVLLAAAPLQTMTSHALLAAGLGAIGGLFFDSLLGATAERKGWLNNDAVNFLSTLAAAFLSATLLIL